MASLTDSNRTDDFDRAKVVIGDKDSDISADLFTRADSQNALVTNSWGSENITTSGSLSALNATLSTTTLHSMATIGVTITGTWVGTISFEATIDGTNWFSMNALKLGGIIISSTTTNAQFRINCAGTSGFRVKMSSYTSGTATITMISTSAVSNRGQNFILGGTDATSIGNVGDRLKVDASVVLAGGATQSYTKKLRYDDMNATTGTLARGASVTAASGWNKVYGYLGTGLLSGVVISLETKDDWQIRIVVDEDEIFGTGTGNGILSTDMHTDSIYDSDTSGRSVPELDQDLGLFWGAHDRFQWVGPLLIPITYNTGVDVYIRRAVGSAAKKFQAGYIVIEKRT